MDTIKDIIGQLKSTKGELIDVINEVQLISGLSYNEWVSELCEQNTALIPIMYDKENVKPIDTISLRYYGLILKAAFKLR